MITYFDNMRGNGIVNGLYLLEQRYRMQDTVLQYQALEVYRELFVSQPLVTIVSAALMLLHRTVPPSSASADGVKGDIRSFSTYIFHLYN